MDPRTTPETAARPSPTHGSQDELMTPAEVAALFRVDPKTVTRWATAGKLTSLRTLGGHRRYHAGEVRSLLNQAHGGVDGADITRTDGAFEHERRA